MQDRFGADQYTTSRTQNDRRAAAKGQRWQISSGLRGHHDAEHPKFGKRAARAQVRRCDRLFDAGSDQQSGYSARPGSAGRWWYHPTTPPQRALARMFTFIDLFAGIGGTRLGFEAAGGSCVFGSEYERFAVHTYAVNHGEIPAGDITKLLLDEIPEHDVLVAGFPCQPFSIAGVSKLNALGLPNGFDHPNQGHLFFSTRDVLAYRQPRAFLLENVKHLRNHDSGRTYETIRDALDELGYNVDDKVIDARALVPQHRERIFIVGFRDAEDFKRFRFPELADAQPSLEKILEKQVGDRYTLSDHLWGYLQAYAEKHRARGNGFGFGLPDLAGVSRTLSARYYKDGSEILIRQAKGANPRRLTPRECARLMGFPETFDIPVSDTRAYQQFGNSVVVPVVEAIARAMARAMTIEPPEAEGKFLEGWKPRGTREMAPPIRHRRRVPARAE